MGANELSAKIWREREMLEMLLFKLEEEQLLLTAGKSRWVGHASREVEQVMAKLRDIALERTLVTAALAEEWGFADDATLRTIAGTAPEGAWRDIFTAHLLALTELTDQIREVRDTNEQYLRAAVRGVQETLAGADAAPAMYDARGTTEPAPSLSLIIDESL